MCDCRAYATLQRDLVESGTPTGVPHLTRLHGFVGNRLPMGLIDDAKSLTYTKFMAATGSISFERLRSLLTFVSHDYTGEKYVAVHGDGSISGDRHAVVTCTILKQLCQDKPVLYEIKDTTVLWSTVFCGDRARVDRLNARGAALVAQCSLTTNGTTANVLYSSYSPDSLNSCKTEVKRVRYHLSRLSYYPALSYKRRYVLRALLCVLDI